METNDLQNNKIDELVKNINKLSTIYKELNNLVIEQGSLSDRIDAMSKTHEAEILNLNKKLGTSQSQLVTEQALSKQYKDELTKKDADFEKERKKYKLEIKSRDDMIAVLQGKINGGNSGTTGGNCTTQNGEKPKLDYFWEDNLGRFSLKDPDVFTKNNEVFNYKLKFSIKGEIFTDKKGNIQKFAHEETQTADLVGHSNLFTMKTAV